MTVGKGILNGVSVVCIFALTIMSLITSISYGMPVWLTLYFLILGDAALISYIIGTKR